MSNPVVSFKIDAQRARVDIAKIDQAGIYGAMNGLRATGRVVRTASRRAAPRYKGPRTDVVKGQLRKSIRSSSKVRVEKATGMFRISVGPRGPSPAWKYGPVIERSVGYMRAGHAAGEAAAPGIFEAENAKALAKALGR